MSLHPREGLHVPLAFALAVGLAGCVDNALGIGGGGTGALSVQAVTTGADADLDGYAVTVDGGAEQSIGSVGSLSFLDLAVGVHAVTLSAVADNCSVDGGATASVFVTAGTTANVVFRVACVSVVGSLEVSTTVVGATAPATFAVSVDGAAVGDVTAGGSEVFGPVAVGAHSVELAVPGNCAIAGPAARDVSVPSGTTHQTAAVAFDVTCD